jgi:hypothetical protein
MSNTILRQVVSGDEEQKLLRYQQKLRHHWKLWLSRSKCSFRTVGGLPNITADGHDALEQLFFEDGTHCLEILKGLAVSNLKS